MNNYEFCADFAQRAATGRPGFKVLDYGCGAGDVISIMHTAGLDAYGCETFYEGGDVRQRIPPDLKEKIVEMQGDRIPFPDATFDLVLSNQVLEHVADLDIVLAEIRRVLKPSGTSLNLFPHREVWREGHCNIPFLHRFPKDAKLRVYYAAALRSLGIGYFKGDKTPMQWARDFCQWLDMWCHYRPLKQIDAAFRRHLSKPQYIEPQWLVSRKATFRFAPVWFRQALTRKAAGLVLVATKA